MAKTLPSLAVPQVRAAWLLSDCPRLITTFSSNLGRLAYELQYAKRLRALATAPPSGGGGGAAAGGGGGAWSLDLPWYAMP